MSKQKKNKFNSITFDGFGGVDRKESHSGKLLAKSIVNFRILKDGSLSKRQGFNFVTDFGEDLRALYSATVNGETILFLLLGNTAYTYAVATKELSPLGEVGTDNGNACFFHFRERLYLTDSQGIYEYRDGEFSPVSGYVPLVAKDWPNDLVCDVNEPRNILNRRARATFLVADPPSPFLCVGEPVESIEAVYVNQAKQKSERYSIDQGFNAIVVQGLVTGDRVEVHYTYQNGYDTLLSRLLSSSYSAIFGGIGNSRIFLCGNNGSGAVFGSKNVSELDISRSQKEYPDSNGLYFPIGYEFDAGNGINSVQSIIRHGDRLLIFTEGDVWMISPDEGKNDASGAVSVNAGLGCPVFNGAVLTDNDVISIGNGAVWKWTASSGSQGGYVSEKLSAPIEDAVIDGFFKNCGLYYDSARRELWVYGKSSETAWIYGFDSKAWYSFTGISADSMLDLDGNAAFIKDGKLYVFDDSRSTDRNEEGIETVPQAIYIGNSLDFGSSEYKNLSSVVFRGDLHYGNIVLIFESDSGEEVSYTLSDSKNYDHSVFQKRLSSGRFKYGNLSLISSSGRGQIIHSLTLSAR